MRVQIFSHFPNQFFFTKILQLRTPAHALSFQFAFWQLVYRFVGSNRTYSRREIPLTESCCLLCSQLLDYKYSKVFHGKHFLKTSLLTFLDSWLQRDFDVDDRHGGGKEKIFEGSEFEALLAKDSCQTRESLGVTQQAISKRFKAMEMIQKQENWFPFELKPRSWTAFLCLWAAASKTEVEGVFTSHRNRRRKMGPLR